MGSVSRNAGGSRLWRGGMRELGSLVETTAGKINGGAAGITTRLIEEGEFHCLDDEGESKCVLTFRE